MSPEISVYLTGSGGSGRENPGESGRYALGAAGAASAGDSAAAGGRAATRRPSRFQGFWCRVQDSGFRVRIDGSWFRV